MRGVRKIKTKGERKMQREREREIERQRGEREAKRRERDRKRERERERRVNNCSVDLSVDVKTGPQGFQLPLTLSFSFFLKAGAIHPFLESLSSPSYYQNFLWV
jgi:hypothetical protein